MIRVLTLIIPVIVGSYIAYDLHKRGYFIFGLIAGFLAAISFPIGPIIYFLVIQPKLKIKPKQTTFCPKCGYSTTKSITKCPKCKNTLSLN